MNPPARPQAILAEAEAPAEPVGVLPGLIPPQAFGRSTALIGQVVVNLGYATTDAVERAVERARESGRLTGRVLIEEGVLTPQQLARVLAERFGIERLDLANFAVDADIARLVDPSFVRRYDAIPVGVDPSGLLLLAMGDPTNLLAIDDVTMATGMQVRPAVAAYDDIHRISNKLGADFPELDEHSQVETNELDLSAPPDIDVTDLGSGDEAPIIKLVNSILKRAIRRGASDIHFDPGPDDTHVVYRVDGMLDSAVTIPRRLTPGVVSRFKVMASLDIAERRAPQDGRVALAVDGHEIDLRVVTIPTVFGEAIVARVLDQSTAPGDLIEIGMLEDDRDKLRSTLMRPYGGVLVCGPTGSGKSTTLYSALGEVADGTRTIITIEDPVEYRIEGIKQMAINPKGGVTFATGLKSIMRADPDIIMVGEIRDKETAQIAVEAALTGHMVLSTLHTRDAPNSISRLLDMGVEPFLLSSAIDCVIAQRLARRLCNDCRRPVAMSAEVLRDHGFDAEHDLEVFEPAGCERCNDTGYRGRVGVFEVLVLDDEIRRMVLERASADEIRQVASDNGMRRLRADGFLKVQHGITTPAEIARVTAAS